MDELTKGLVDSMTKSITSANLGVARIDVDMRKLQAEMVALRSAVVAILVGFGGIDQESALYLLEQSEAANSTAPSAQQELSKIESVLKAIQHQKPSKA